MKKFAVSLVVMFVAAFSFMPAASATRTATYDNDVVCLLGVQETVYVIIGQTPAEKIGCGDIAYLDHRRERGATYYPFDEIGLCGGSGKQICERGDALAITQTDLDNLDPDCIAPDDQAAIFQATYMMGEDCVFEA